MIEIAKSSVVDNVISSSHLGGNFLFNRGKFHEGIGEDGGFDEVASTLNVTHLRYPGGAMTEVQFNLADPENDFQDTRLNGTAKPLNPNKYELTPMSEFLEYASEIGGEVSIVLPTGQYRLAILRGHEEDLASAKAEIQKFIHDALTGNFGDVIEAFELGNEYYSKHTMFTPEQYGQIANTMAIWIQEAIDASNSGYDPMIAVQTAKQHASDNNAIIAEFSAEGLDAIDAVVGHTYQKTPWDSGNIANKATLLDAWNDAKGGGADLPWMISEWDLSKAAQSGLLQGAGILEMFNELIKNGMDIGHIWPLLENTRSTLAGDVVIGEHTPLFTGGLVYRQMSESLIGLNAISFESRFDVDSDVDPDVLIHAYISPDGNKLVVFVSSIDGASLDFDLDVSSLGPIAQDYDHLAGKKIGVLEGENPLNSSTLPVETTLLADEVEGASDGDGILSVKLKPYEIVRYEFTIGEGVTLSGSDQIATNDVIFGSDFNDIINGHEGDDILKGRAGNDYIDGGSGKDALHGHLGDDVLIAGEGDDRMYGGSGDDYLYGNGGDDLIRGGHDNDFLFGGSGADTFVFKGDWGTDTIMDFEDDVDKIVLYDLDVSSIDEILALSKQVGDDVEISFVNGEVLHIENTTIEAVSDDFIFL